MNIVSNIDFLTLPLKVGNNRQFFPKDVSFPRMSHLSVLIAEEGQDINIPLHGKKAITRNMANRIFITLVDCEGKIIYDSIALSNIDVLFDLKFELADCINWSRSFISKINMEKWDEDTITKYCVPFYFFQTEGVRLNSGLQKSTTIEVPAKYEGAIHRFVSEDQCLGVNSIKITTEASNNVWLDLVDSFGRGYEFLYKNIFLSKDGICKSSPNWCFDGIVFDLEESIIFNGNSTSYITFYHK